MYIQMYNFLVKCRAFQFSQCLSQSVSYRRKTLHSPICVLTINFPFHFRASHLHREKKLLFDGNEKIRLRSIYQLIYIYNFYTSVISRHAGTSSEIKKFGISRKSSAKIGRNVLCRRSQPNFTDPFRSLIFETRAKLNTCNNFSFSSEKEISRKKGKKLHKRKKKATVI